MKLCVPVPCFFPKEDFCRSIEIIGSLGYKYAETYNWSSLNLENVKNSLEENGVTLVSMCTTEFRMTDPQYRRLWLEGLEKSCIAAGKLGVKKLITQVGPDTGAERGYQHESIVSALKEAIPILEKYGVTVMPEPLNVLVNHPGYYLTTAKEGFDIIREVGHPFVKLIFDIYHQQVTEGNIIPNVTGNLNLIAHLHSAGHPGRHELQFGENDYKNIFAAIDKAGYKGCCGLEYNPVLDPIESLKLSKEIYG